MEAPVYQQPNMASNAPRYQPNWVWSVLWAVFIGWWVALIWDACAWFLAAIVYTMPNAVVMLNRSPIIFDLRQPPPAYVNAAARAVERILDPPAPQYPIWLRFLYWLFVGWWFSACWIAASWLLTITYVGIPYARWMFNRVPGITTLKRL